jgi:hypothetical protein
MECTGFLLSVARLSLTKRSVALRPHLAAGLPLSQRRIASACENHTNLEMSYLYAIWPFFSMPRQARLYARWLSLGRELRRTP